MQTEPMSTPRKPLGAKAAAAVTPRPAATTLVLRDGAPGLEVLMVRRSMQASFMPGAYVFPGGAVEKADGSARCAESAEALHLRVGRVMHVHESAGAFAVAALRECFEECGLWLGLDAAPQPLQLAALRRRLHAGEAFDTLAEEASLPLATAALQPWSHWVTPLGLPKRFDTLFFVAAAPAHQEPSVDEGETTTLAWVHPPAALEARRRGEFQMEFATVQTVKSLLPFSTQGVAALFAHAAAQASLPPLHPRLKLDAEGHVQGVLLPGQPGYDEAALLPDGP